MKKDLYEILGVEKTATQAEIKKAYKKLAQQYHPDMHANASDEEKAVYEEKFKEINNAHEILSNEEKRAAYDRELAREEARRQSTSSSKANSETAYKKTATEPRTTKEHHEDDEWNNEEINLFDMFFEYLEKTKKEYTEAWKEIRKQEKKYPFKKRHQDISKDIREDYAPDEDKITSKIGHGIFSGIIHVSVEFAYQLAKLKHIKTDDFPRFVIRNRNLLATVLATAIILTGVGGKTETQKEEPSEQTGIEITIDDEEVKQINIDRKYTIEYGDTASGLAQSANCTVEELCRINGIRNSGNIYQGDEIIIPYYYNEEDMEYFTEVVTCEGNVHISEIAEEYNTTTGSIRTLNGEAIDENGNVISSTILVPNFISKYDLAEKKATTAYTYS